MDEQEQYEFDRQGYLGGFANRSARTRKTLSQGRMNR